MENNMLFNDDLLWDYADGLLDAAEYQRVTALLQRQPEAQSRLADILAEKKSFAALPLEAPQPGFSDRVLAAWAVEQMQLRPLPSPRKRRDWMIIAITGIFGLCLLLPVVVLLVATLRGEGPTLPADYALPTVDWGLVLANPVLYYTVGLALAFFSLRLLDKYLQQKKTWQPVTH